MVKHWFFVRLGDGAYQLRGKFGAQFIQTSDILSVGLGVVETRNSVYALGQPERSALNYEDGTAALWCAALFAPPDARLVLEPEPEG